MSDLNTPVDLYVYPTNIRFKMPDNITLENGLDIREFIRSLTEFSYHPKLKKWLVVRVYSIRNETTGVGSIPRYYLKYLVDYIQYYSGKVNIHYDTTTDPGRSVELKLNPWWKPREDQISAINFLVHNDKHMRALPLSVASGKTIMCLISLSQIGKVPLIVLNGLIEQWYKVIAIGNNGKPPVFDIDPDLVYVIKGQDSLLYLLEHPEYKPSIIIASISTIRNYISRDMFPYNAMPPFEDFVKQMGVGVKVHDECHQCFSTIMDIDLRANIDVNIYLSATLTRGDRQSKKIFSKVFPELVQYQGGNTVGHIRTYYLPYNIGFISERKVCTKNYGYNQNRYELFILNNLHLKLAFIEFIHNCVAAYFINEKKDGQRCIVMANTVTMCQVLCEYLTEMYPDLTVALYLGGSDERVLSESDIIISTVKKGGTGTDIQNLKTMINTVSIGSEILVRQIPGRLRKLPDGDTPIYVAMWNTVLDCHKRHYKYCRTFYMKNSKEYYDLSNVS